MLMPIRLGAWFEHEEKSYPLCSLEGEGIWDLRDFDMGGTGFGLAAYPQHKLASMIL